MTRPVPMYEIIARYLLDRADQYATGSASWHGLADAAEALMHGEHIKAYMAGELDDSELIARVRRLAHVKQR